MVRALPKQCRSPNMWCFISGAVIAALPEPCPFIGEAEALLSQLALDLNTAPGSAPVDSLLERLCASLSQVPWAPGHTQQQGTGKTGLLSMPDWFSGLLKLTRPQAGRLRPDIPSLTL
jgi:hypothetical protein